MDNLEKAKYEFQAAAEEILAGTQGSDYEKEVYVHNALADRIEYDLQARFIKIIISIWRCIIPGNIHIIVLII